MMKMRKVFTLAGIGFCLFALALYGCSIGPAETSPVHSYLLNPDISAKKVFVNAVRNDPPTLLISSPKAQPGFETPRMAYLLRKHELSYYAFNQWADAPGRMMLGLLAQAMEATGLWHAVVQAPTPMRADYRLDCDNLAVEQQFFSQPSRVRLALRAQLIELNKRKILATREFELFEAAPTEDAYGGVVAANRAAARLLEELALWVGTSMSESVEAGE
jgi:cholesterol transport system auxiliary component